MVKSYPKYGRDYPNGGITDIQFANMIGGKVKLNIDNKYFSNTCALRVCYTLNRSGESIPYINSLTSSENGAWHIFRVAVLINYMTETYGSPNVVSSDPNQFTGLKGIIIYDTGSLWSDATGHATLWNGSRRLGGNYPNSYYLNNGVGKLWITE